MAKKLDRNVNLEEIASDGLFGIKQLEHQTMSQKVLFFGGIVLGIAIFIITDFFIHIPGVIAFFLMMLVAGIGVLFGANQTENMTMAEYLKLMLFKPVKYMEYKSTEDSYLMQEEAKNLKAEEELKLRQASAATPETQRQLLIKLIAGISIGVLVIGTLFGIALYKKSHTTHHIVETGYIEYQI